MNKKTWFFIIVGFLVASAVGFYIGIKYDSPPAVEVSFTARIDSLMEVNRLLQDSLAATNAEVKTVTKDVIKYRTKYDTVRVSENTNELLANLKTIINTPVD